MKKIKIMSVVGARPNFMKIAPFAHAIEAHNKTQLNNPSTEPLLIEHVLIHTGQHYDRAMSESFFESLNIPRPDVDLEIGSGSHAEQVGRTMIEFEKVLLEQKPDWVVVVGDVNATCACSITAKKHHIKVAHIEAGLRSFDERMPEEINRLVTDRLSDLLLTPDEIASQNLRNEGVPEEKIKFVGNIMIDTLEANRDRAAQMDLNEIIRCNLIPPENGCQKTEVSGLRTEGNHQPTTDNQQLVKDAFSVLTMHRPSNVDEKQVLGPLVRLLIDEISAELPLVWSVHPRTKKNLQQFGLWDEIVKSGNIILINPVGYHEMLKLNMGAKIMLTDSGGLQEESCVVGTPCITMRATTERPVTLVEYGGVSELTGPDPDKIRAAFKKFLAMDCSGHCPPLWDGKTAARIVESLCIYETTGRTLAG